VSDVKSDGDEENKGSESDDDDSESDDDDEKDGGSDSEGDESGESSDESDTEETGVSGKDADSAEIEKETVEDRVFVCVGTYRKNPRKRAVWVMTIDKDFQVVTHWNPVQHKELELRDRISKDQVDDMKAYLTPEAWFKENKDEFYK